MDFSKLQLASSASSNKILLQGTGSFNVSALGGVGETFGAATIPHGFSSDNLLFQVATDGGPTDGVVLPWSSNDNRVIIYAMLDSTNLYVYFISSDSGGFGAPAFTVTYSYRILIP